MTNLGKQIESTQETVNEILHRQAELSAAPGGSTVTGISNQTGTSSTTRPAPRLANMQPPLLATPEEPPAGVTYLTAHTSPVEPVAEPVLQQDQVQQVEPVRRRTYVHEQEHPGANRREHLPDRDRDYAVKPPKHDFPNFSGENPNLWLDLAITYFEMHQVPVHQWVSTAALYLDGHAALWWQAFKRRRGLWPWDDFAQQVLQEFGQEEYDTHMTSLLQLKQKGTVSEYQSCV